MNSKPLIPVLYYAAASFLTIASLRLRKPARVLSLGPIWLLSILSLTSSRYLTWPFGANSTFASLVVFYLPYTVKLLVIDENYVNPEFSSGPSSFVDCYRAWNNPRKLPLDSSLLDKKSSTRESRVKFTLKKVIWAIFLWTFDSFVVQAVLFEAFSYVAVSDFAPDMEWPSLSLSSHQLLLRSVMSVQWIWSAYFFLEFSHCILGLAFVSILGFDRPEEWPALFGSPLEAQNLRAFWGRFWHRVTLPTYNYYALLFCRKVFGIEPKSRLEKTLVPMLIFTMSGISHSMVGWAIGDAGLHRDILFFQMNFLGCAVETVVRKTKAYRMVQELVPSLISGILGMVWVFGFFFCITPSWMYPKIYYALNLVL
ncbi:hypothetical protein NM208_g13123 [Fusarium decemcellulare]|uniref:Uncharacterized protein n=1 Tax=Fusarium decemcellulare TaxID=57161 RepID=A0ACC1RPI5_9HYPO|nr:hypothetical protein NM208_g13123 [Fusarium decemcellulare]